MKSALMELAAPPEGGQADFFATLPAGAAQRLLQYSRTRQYSAGELLYRPGATLEEILLLLEGAVKVYVKEPAPLIFEIVLPGELLGSVASGGQQEYAEALAPALVRAFPLRTLFELPANGTSPGHGVLDLYCRYAAKARALWHSVVSEDVPQRVGRRLIELLRHVAEAPGMATVPVRLRQEDLAHMVGSTRTTVSEILNDFERRGLVELKRAGVRVDRARLKAALWPAG